MTAVVATALCVVAVTSVGLGYAVWRLRTQVDALSVQLLAASSHPQAASPSQSAPGLFATRDTAESSRPSTPRPDAHGSAPPAEGFEGVEPPRLDAEPDRDVPVVSITDICDDGPVEPAASRVVSVTLAGPLIKVAALSHGVRSALSEESRMRIGYAVHRELKRQRKLRRRQSLRRASAQGRRP